jgi:membrane-bound metal-dependent hydrolase YbcI (DUF457 family)
MATPIGHALAGYAVLGVLAGRVARRPAMVVVAVAMGNIPDLDFLPGLILGAPALYHQGITHSLGTALALSVLVALVLRRVDMPFASTFVVSILAYTSHLALDFFGPDARPPYGQLLLWPLSDARFVAPVVLLPGVQHAAATSASTVEWVSGILHAVNLRAIVIEVLVVAPFAYWTRSRLRAQLPHQQTAAPRRIHQSAAPRDVQP